MRPLQNLSIKAKLNRILGIATVAVLGTVFVGFVLGFAVFSRKALIQEITSIGKVTGATSRAALVFNDREAGQRILSGLDENKSILYAVLFHNNGSVLASHKYGNRDAIFAMRSEDGPVYSWSFKGLSVVMPIELDGERVGWIGVETAFDSFYQQLGTVFLIETAVLLLAFAVAAYFSSSLKKWISDPIASLTNFTQELVVTKDLSSRLDISGEDEVQRLLKSFNRMMEKLEQQNIALGAAKEKAELAVKVKSMFLATVSHELRTPIHAILGMTDEVLQSGINNEQREMLDIVKSAGKTLLFVINDILDFSAIESGKMRLTPKQFNVLEFVKSTVLMFELAARQKSLRLGYQIAANVPQEIIADSARLGQIIVNLIGNALKFTPTGFIELTVKLVSTDPKEHRTVIQFSVTDTGTGIEKEHLKTIFESFSKIRRSGEAIEGTGLGLSISQRLAEMMGGAITVQSEIGKGSTFTFNIDCELPTARVDRVIEASEFTMVVKQTQVEHGKYRILLAEDNIVNRRIAERILERAGYEVVCAENGQLCVEVFRSQQVHLILMDFDMPIMDGIEATKEIRKIEEKLGLSSIPIIAFTASAGSDEILRGLNSGMNSHVAKPIDADALISEIRRYLPLSDLTQANRH